MFRLSSVSSHACISCYDIGLPLSTEYCLALLFWTVFLVFSYRTSLSDPSLQISQLCEFVGSDLGLCSRPEGYCLSSIKHRLSHVNGAIGRSMPCYWLTRSKEPPKSPQLHMTCNIRSVRMRVRETRTEVASEETDKPTIHLGITVFPILFLLQHCHMCLALCSEQTSPIKIFVGRNLILTKHSRSQDGAETHAAKHHQASVAISWI
uniref:uncharacterized protein LOC109971130 n=1 Tax=Monopterus albus TaxID=43700 RepID=UPI0009B40707|nr:uncharacterized protein LOC109971130 [Monopterus albus]